MCIVGLSISPPSPLPSSSSPASSPLLYSSLFPFLCCHNRDEDINRPTLPPSYTFSPIDSSSSPLICGFDVLKGGSWMGVNVVNGNLVSITNMDKKENKTEKDNHNRNNNAKSKYQNNNNNNVTNISHPLTSRGLLVKSLLLHPPIPSSSSSSPPPSSPSSDIIDPIVASSIVLISHQLSNQLLSTLSPASSSLSPLLPSSPLPPFSFSFTHPHYFDGFSLLYCNLYSPSLYNATYCHPYKWVKDKLNAGMIISSSDIGGDEKNPLDNLQHDVPICDHSDSNPNTFYCHPFSYGVHSFSNSHINDSEWEKCSKLKIHIEGKMREEVKISTENSDGQGVQDYQNIIDSFMESIATLLLDPSPLSLSDSSLPSHIITDDCCPLHSSLPLSTIFRPSTHYDWPTRCQTVVSVCNGDHSVNYWYRDVENWPVIGEWRKYKWEIPTKGEKGNEKENDKE